MSVQATDPASRSIALGFVVFRAAGNFLRRLRLAHDAGWRLYVFDNSPDIEVVRDTCMQLQRCCYASAGRNAGLGVGIASISEQAYNDGFAALLFFDQDTVFDAATLEFVEAFHAHKPDMAVTHTAVVFNARHREDARGADPFAHRNVLLSISSGSLFYLENLRRIGWHSRSYFVDCVDYEFCLRSRQHGFLVGECLTTPGFDHASEQADVAYSVLGRVRRLRRYPWPRIADSVRACVTLCADALRTREGRFAFAILRYLAGYLYWQLAVRVLRPRRVR